MRNRRPCFARRHGVACDSIAWALDTLRCRDGGGAREGVRIQSRTSFGCVIPRSRPRPPPIPDAPAKGLQNDSRIWRSRPKLRIVSTVNESIANTRSLDSGLAMTVLKPGVVSTSEHDVTRALHVHDLDIS